MTAEKPSSADQGPARKSNRGPLAFGTADEQGVDRFELWRDTYSPVHQVEVEPDRRAAFQAQGLHWFMGPMVFGLYTTPARRITRSRQQSARDGLDHCFVRVPKSSTIRSRTGDQTFVLRPREVAFGSYAYAYDEEQDAGEWVTLLLPRAALPWLKGSDFGPRVLTGAMANVLADLVLSLGDHLWGATEEELARLSMVVIGLLQACIQPDKDAARETILPVLVQRVIDSNLSSPRLTPQRICELTGLSRSQLYRLFEPLGGVSDHVQRLRLEAIRRDLASDLYRSLPIRVIAEHRGMYNTASFNRAFRRRFGCTPGDIRKAHIRPGNPDPALASGLPAGGRYMDLLLATGGD